MNGEDWRDGLKMIKMTINAMLNVWFLFLPKYLEESKGLVDKS